MEFLKNILRFFYYKNQRKKVFREQKIRKRQNKLIIENYSKDIENLIVFMVDGADWFTGKDNISGGIMSIASIYEESEKLKKIHNSNVIMITHKTAHLLLKHTQFPNNIFVFRYKQLIKYFQNLKKVIIHVPEYLVPTINKQFAADSLYFTKIPDLQINILNQRIDIMPDVSETEKLKQVTRNITQTTAHENYTTLELRNKYNIPVHKLSVFGSPEKYKFTDFEQKENLLIVSPDEIPQKSRIIYKIKTEIPDLKIIIIENLTYTEYLNTISKAKFALTFGEGLDFYFVETVFSGGIGFAVYNEDFFTKEFKELPFIYKNYKDLEDLIVKDFSNLKNKELFVDTNKQQFMQCSKLYKYNEYLENIEKFYKKEYTFK